MNLSEASAPFLNYCQVERHVSPATVAKYRDCLQCWLLPWLGGKEVENLTKVEILDLRKAMVDKALSVARQYSVIMCLKSFLKFCRSTLDARCLDPNEISLPKRPAPEVQYLTDEEIQRVLDAIPIHTFTGARLRALVELLLATGMRISESLSLDREAFEAGAQEAEIVGKGKRKRFVFFSPRCRHWVREYLDRRLDHHSALFVTTGFPPRRFKREDVHRFFADLKQKAGLTKKFTPHILRHTFCTMLRNNGADISHIKDLAGHQDIHTTARYYLGKDKAVLREVMDRCLNYGLRDPQEERRAQVVNSPQLPQPRI